MFPVVLAAVALLWLGTLRVFLVTTRPEMSKALRAVVAVGSLAALMGLYLLLLAPAVAGFMPPWALSGSASIVVRHVSEAFPGAGLLVWAACVAAVAAAYLRVERRFARAPSVFLRGGTQSV
jgi:hypothetical protein